MDQFSEKHNCCKALKDAGLTPYADVLVWKRRFWVAMALLALTVWLWATRS
jgi:hypothetical protein